MEVRSIDKLCAVQGRVASQQRSRARGETSGSAAGLRTAIALLMLAVLATGCATPIPVPMSDRSGAVSKQGPVRVVRQGESLYSIAWEAGKDPEQLAKINKLETPYRLRPGQKIVIDAPGNNTRQATTSTAPLLKSKPASRSVTIGPTAGDGVDPKAWLWPVGGNVVNGFAPTRGRKGIDIQSREGDTVRSTAAGRVVYAGAGLRGYGRVVIVKHGDRYLSAYAHNRRLTVAEGQSVKAGQKIAEVGLSARNQPELHFEIRKDGKPVDPRQYLPQR